MISGRRPRGGRTGTSRVDGAWFVRTRRGRHCALKPASLGGHLLTAAFAAFVTGISWLFAWLVADRDVDPAVLVVWIVTVLAATFLFILTAWRMSAPAAASQKGSRKCS